jgi:Recombination endonuclease VII
MAMYGICEICCEPRKMNHDHEPDTGPRNYRGWLCTLCNSRLGWLERNRSMITKYLERNHEIDKPLFYSLDDCLQDAQKRGEAMMREYYESRRLERSRRRALARDTARPKALLQAAI